MGMNLTELVEHTGVSLRTVRYYIQQGLVPGPDGLGPKSTYNEGHIARLRLIRAWQEEFLPLAEIRSRLESLGEDGVIAEAANLGNGTALGSLRVSGFAAAYALGVMAKAQPEAAPVSPPRPARSPSTSSLQRSAWDRIALTADIEVHVRRPLSRLDNRRLDQLIDAARAIFAKGNP